MPMFLADARIVYSAKNLRDFTSEVRLWNLYTQVQNGKGGCSFEKENAFYLQSHGWKGTD